MSDLFLPEDYKSKLSLHMTQKAIGKLKRSFEDNLSAALNLTRVSAPLFVSPETGLNDNLNGIERPVEFDLAETGKNVQVVQSLAKWKRMALHKYGFERGEGIYTDMNAIRRDEVMDNLHSVYVDQWDWEKVIGACDRNIDFLKDTVISIVGAICDTTDEVRRLFPDISTKLSREVAFITTQELEDMYPGLKPKAREDCFLKDHPTAFIMKIGGMLDSGVKHDGRAPDYDDWELNGDIVFWNELLGCAHEVSSMGIRVDSESLDRQLRESGCDNRRDLDFHRKLLKGELPLSIGGGIGQSRLSMLILQKAHIGEVQVSVWDDKTLERCSNAGIGLL
ncbi:MAG: aspartate--ammonia ligase [Eubacteriales bacterium]|nr:aspartate--ammonia ligase [Eubacteriales bacterium]